MFIVLILLFSHSFLTMASMNDDRYTGSSRSNKVELEMARQIHSSSSRLRILHFVRHGHGTHNAVGELRYEDYMLEEHEDAMLTEIGLNQCAELSRESFPKIRRVDALCVSPMRRTLQTAQYSFPSLINKIPWIALESLREQTGLHPCDRRRPISELAPAHPHVDFSLIKDESDPLYWQYAEREPADHVTKRCLAFLEWVSESSCDEMVVVTHSAFLRHMLPLLEAKGASLGSSQRDHFDNCEMRSFALYFQSS